jgi:NAD(P)-dependent dehydrogenase (short-subunit alcohol dehydrogenase family)
MSTLSINTIAAIRLCNQVLPSMKRRKFGRIVNVSSSIHQKADQIAYSCSKAALDRYTSDIAPSLHGTGIAICSIDPGWLKTDMGGDAASLSVDTVIPGALLGIIMSNYKPGVWFSAQDYRGLTVEQAVAKARLLFQQPIDNR